MFFTSDHHFGHRAIIELCARPFADVDEMNETMVNRWNRAVGRHDEVWHLGDFGFRGGGDLKREIFDRLNGRKRLVIGNHDNGATLALPWSAPPVHLAVVQSAGKRIVMCHYGLRVWPGLHHGAIHLYGHSHGKLPGNSLSLDVGVDAWDFRPASIEEIREHLGNLPAYADPEHG
ncbi:metallophosphoesterase [Lichenihabitans sp. Uapishka_5]|uniref:metallophosphoesterase n=1 Tax=Lichenihabitans sp. Uapishka_5 TaxID=3037302 RepID=UPI0029E7CD8F|nr:metallophosphoesterase [Lichenihabitans sp. Uapishka_5]MDX7952862.1 metallophosphoesterase [Lichenihabitans sp. Uapishka_5]